jgi:hypothetical protein
VALSEIPPSAGARDRERRCRLPHARRGIFRLARFTAASRQYAQSQRDPHGDRRGLCTGLEVQGVLGADLRWARPPSRLVLAGLPFTESLVGVGNRSARLRGEEDRIRSGRERQADIGSCSTRPPFRVVRSIG